MTTAHRATWVHAKGRGVGAEGSYQTGGVGSAAFSSKDLPGQLTLKRRDPESAAALAKRNLKKELEDRERRAREKRTGIQEDVGSIITGNEGVGGGGGGGGNSNSVGVAGEGGRVREIGHPSSSQPVVELVDKVDIDDEDNILKQYDDSDETGESEEGNNSNDSESDDDSSSDDDEDDELELLRELEKIKKEREEARALQQAEEDAQKDASVVSANPLLNPSGGASTGSGSIKRRWDDDVVFRNQTAGEDNKARKRFVNDTVRNDFHRRFLKKYIQ